MRNVVVASTEDEAIRHLIEQAYNISKFNCNVVLIMRGAATTRKAVVQAAKDTVDTEHDSICKRILELIDKRGPMTLRDVARSSLAKYAKRLRDEAIQTLLDGGQIVATRTEGKRVFYVRP